MLIRTGPGQKALRKDRWSDPGRIYFTTTSTWNRRRLFLDHDLARTVARLSHRPPIWGSARLLGWVLLPDHGHGLLELEESTDLSSVMRRFKSVTALEVNAGLGSEGPVWQRGFHDHALRKSEAVVDVLRYRIANPVRACLCRSAWSYPYWDVRMVEAGILAFDELAEFPD